MNAVYSSSLVLVGEWCDLSAVDPDAKIARMLVHRVFWRLVTRGDSARDNLACDNCARDRAAKASVRS